MQESFILMWAVAIEQKLKGVSVMKGVSVSWVSTQFSEGTAVSVVCHGWCAWDAREHTYGTFIILLIRYEEERKKTCASTWQAYNSFLYTHYCTEQSY